MKTVFCLEKIAITVGFCSLVFSKGISQDAHLSTPDPGQMMFVNFDPNKDVFNISGASTASMDQREIAGSPYFLSYWVKGKVVFVNGKVYRDGMLKFNLATNQLQFLYDQKTLVFADRVKWFTLTDTSGKSATFNSGYASIGGHKSTTFYQLMAEGGKLQLLKYIAKHTDQQYQYNSLAKLSYKLDEDYFLYDVQTQEMRYVGTSSGALEKALDDYDASIKDQIKAMGKKRLSENDIIALVDNINKTQ